MPTENVTTYLKKCFFTKELLHRNFFRHRMVIFYAIKEGVFSIKEACQLLLPSKISPQKTTFLRRYYDFLKKKSEEEILAYTPQTNPLNVYGFEFFDIDHTESVILFDQIILSDQYCAKKFLKEDSVVIDAGANLGVFSIFAAQYTPHGSIFAFEPVKKTFDLLKKNVTRYPDIKAVNSGLGDNVADKDIFVKSNGTAESIMTDSPMFEASEYTQGGVENIRVTTIDTFVATNKLTRVDFIKIDTEGYEAKILRGATETIKKYKPVIAMSAYHNEHDRTELPRILKEVFPEYMCELHTSYEADLVCYVKK